MNKVIYIGTDGGATTSKVGGVWSDGSTISTKLLQASTNSAHGPEAVVRSWVEAINTYLSTNALTWEQVGGVGLAVPGPFQRYGVFDHSANLPDNFTGFDVHTAYSSALSERAGRAIPLTVGNDGDMGGVAEAQQARGNSNGTVLMLAPGSGLGCAYINKNGLALDGDTLAGMEGGHMPAPSAFAGRESLPLWMRAYLGLYRNVHVSGWPAISAGRKTGEISRSRPGEVISQP